MDSAIVLFDDVQGYEKATVDKKKLGHKLIRRVSIDQFYALVTGQEDAFYQMCMILPAIIQKVVDNMDKAVVPNDTVVEQLKKIAAEHGEKPDDLAIAMAVYMLGFGGYKGF